MGTLPALLGRRLAFLVGRPDRLAGLGLLERYRHGALGDEVDGLAQTQVLAKQRLAAALAQLRERHLGRVVPMVLVAWPRFKRFEHLLLGDVDVLGLGDRDDHGLALERALGVGLGVGDHSLATALLDLHERFGIDPASLQLAHEAVDHLLRAGLHEGVGNVHAGSVDCSLDRLATEGLVGALVEDLTQLRSDV